MSKHRIHVGSRIEPGAIITIRDDQARYLNRVLRLRRDDDVTLFDGDGGEFPAVICKSGRDVVEVRSGMRIDRSVESPLAITLLQGISRGDRMDHVVRKATEIGAQRVTPVHTDFSVVKLDEKRAAKRLQHWRGVAASACEQCGRNRLPRIDMPESLPNVLASYRENPVTKIILRPDCATTLKSIEVDAGEVVVLVGPEGGFSEQEYGSAAAAGFAAAGFGPRILRTETAAVAVLAALQTLYGDLA